jgi:hypothetical protein
MANVSDPPHALQRVEWYGSAQLLSVCWRLTKPGKVAVCELFNHPLGWELRVNVNDDLVRSEVFRDGDLCLTAAAAWRTTFTSKGWI